MEAQRAQHAAVRPRLPEESQVDSIGQLRVSSSKPTSDAAAVLPANHSSNAAQPTVMADSSGPSASLRRHDGKGQLSPTPSPPRFRRLPSNTLLDRPAWASPTQTQSRAAVVSHQPLRRSAGSPTVTATDERAANSSQQTAAAVASSGPGIAVSHAAPCSDSVPAGSGSHALGCADSQASAESHADFLTDAHAHAQAQALQRLQQAVEEYNSSSPHVLVPAAVELTAALRQAAKCPGQPRRSVEALQLAGLKLKHEAGGSPNSNVPMSPWPEWVRGAWGSPQAHGGLPGSTPHGQLRAAEGAAPPTAPARAAHDGAAARTGETLPQHAQRGPRLDRAAPPDAAWSPAKKSDLANTSRDVLVRRALAEAEAAAARDPAQYPRQGRGRSQNRASASPPRAPAGKSRTSATPPRASAKPSRVSVTPARASVTPPRAAKPPQIAQAPPVLPGRNRVKQRNNLQAALSRASELVKQPPVKGSQGAGSRKRSWQPTSAAPHTFKGHPEPEVPVVEGRQAQSAHWEKPDCHDPSSAQGRQRASALEAFGMPSSMQHMNVELSDCSRAPSAMMHASEEMEQRLHPPHAVHAEAQHDTPESNSNSHHHVAIAPLHSMTSVAALRQSFEQRSSPALGLVDGLKPRNRLPLRKVSSKAHVVEDDGSPQTAALLWQQSLRDEHDGEESNAEHEKAQSDAGSWKSRGSHHVPGMPLPALHLYPVCTISAYLE